MATADRRDPLLVADAGVPYRQVPADPIAAWIELMEVVDALAPAATSPPLRLVDARL